MRSVGPAATLGALERQDATPPRFWLAGRFTPRQVDWIVVAAASLLSVPALVHAAVVTHTSLVPILVALPLGTIPLLWRRTHPGVVLAILAASFAISAPFAGREGTAPGLLFGMFAAALYGGRRTRVAAGVLAVGALVVAFATVLATGDAKTLGHLAGTAFGSGVAWVLGDRTRTRRAYLAQLEDRALGLEHEQEERVRRAAEEERNRIARELHDVVAHNVSVIAVQAGAARLTSEDPSEPAAEALRLIERTARSTLAELRALLGILRKDDGEIARRAPQPTLAELGSLVNRAREAGLHVDVRTEGALDRLPAAVDLSAYRIVQEALTNVMKYAPGAAVHLAVRRTEREIGIVVVDDGPGASPESQGGRGLIGMRERASLVGGRLDVGPALGGGFRVEARLPAQGADGQEIAPATEPSPEETRVP
jgi:signal transduction histidine kinase